MTNFERELQRQRARLLKADANGASAIVARYGRVRKRLNRRLDALTARIVEARRAGEEVRPGWLFAQERYRELVTDFEQHTLAFLHGVDVEIAKSKRTSVALAEDAAPTLSLAAMGAAPAAAQAEIAATFVKLSSAALDQIIRNAGDGHPLGLLLAEIAPQAIEGVRDSLAYGVAAGRPVRAIAREVRDAARIPMVRALTISRQEVLRAYRETSTAMYAASPVVRGWVWYAQLDTRTCPLCWAQHGSEHPADEGLNSHVNCRCTQAPLTRSWRELGYGIPDGRVSLATGPGRFRELTEGDKLAVLGRSRLDAYKRGEITLEDLVRRTHSARWGPGLRLANLSELGVSAAS